MSVALVPLVCSYVSLFIVAFSVAVHMSARLQLLLSTSTISWAGAELRALSSFIPITFLTSDLGHRSSNVTMERRLNLCPAVVFVLVCPFTSFG